MDNDVHGTEYCIGFSTAVTRGVDFITNLRTSTGSHERIAVVELFGRNSGETALVTAYLAGVDRVLISEVPFDIDKLAEMVERDRNSNPSNYAMVAISEGATIGYVGGFPIEEVNRAANAFTIGVREVNPTATVELVFINSWYDPPVEQQAAQALIDAGVEAVSHELNSPAVPSTAEAADVYISGYGFDASANAPTKWLSSFVWNWGAYYVEQVQDMIDGTWEPAQFYGGLSDGMITMSSFGPDVPQDVIDLVNMRMEEITNGTFDIFAGPIFDNQGNEIVAEGATIPREERPACCLWLIEGIEGEIPEG